MSNKRNVIIVGGVAGGASCAARLRRLDEEAEITIYEKGDYVSFANCGLPYRIGGIIQNDAALVLTTPEEFWAKFRVDAKTKHEVISVDAHRKVVRVRNLRNGEEFEKNYTHLVLATGALAIRPPIPGLDLPGVFTVRTIPDTQRIRKWIEENKVRKAVVAGGGFIGLEMAENLKHLGLEVVVVEMAQQILPPMDAEMVRPLERHVVNNGVKLVLGQPVTEILKNGNSLLLKTKNGDHLPADIVIIALGVRPDLTLAKSAGLKIGPRGGVLTNEYMQTSIESIFAVGDLAEVKDFLTGETTLIPLAGPANRQGRVAADVICGRNAKFRGVQGTAVCGVFGMAAASTGLSEKTLRKLGHDNFECAYLHPRNHVAYYPGAKTIHMKIIYRRSDGKLLGAQAVGLEDVPRKIDTLAMALQLGATVFDLEEAELCYSPQYGAAKDAINFAGMIAANSLRKDSPLLSWKDGIQEENYTILDVREEDEFLDGHVENSINIPLSSLRQKIKNIPTEKPLAVYCQVGLRGHTATRILRQKGFTAFNLSGGYQTFLDIRNAD
ncbi:MAG: FAD-dependent oxidoreductase [Chthoniobacterales bacterium]|nr:FAD-dependent oxidoreductase [Chthoniobacterales bacterium]